MSVIAGDIILDPFHQHQFQKQQTQDLDRFLMPPPKGHYPQGSKELQRAVTNREVHLSLPHQDAMNWMNTAPRPVLKNQPQTRHSTTPRPKPREPPKMASQQIIAHSHGQPYNHTVQRKKKNQGTPLDGVGGRAIGNGGTYLSFQREPDYEHYSLFSSGDARIPRGTELQDILHGNHDYQYQEDEHGNTQVSARHFNPAPGSPARGNNQARKNNQARPKLRTSSRVDLPMEISQHSMEVNHEDYDEGTVTSVPLSDAISSKTRKRKNSCSSRSTDTLLTSCIDENNRSAVVVPTSRFQDVIGHQAVKLRLKELLLPLKLSPELYSTVFRGIRTLPASVLFHGPPGTGKTLLAQAVAGEAKAAFLSIGPSDILSKYVGESEAAVRSIFICAKEMARKTESKCAVVFFDEIDALGQSRVSSGDAPGATGTKMETGGTDGCSRKVLAELLIQLTKLNSFKTQEAAVGITPNLHQEGQGSFDQNSIDEEHLNDFEMEGQTEASIETVTDDRVCVLVLAATNREQE
jgi:ATPase family associated with various cellular activities (AAA)